MLLDEMVERQVKLDKLVKENHETANAVFDNLNLKIMFLSMALIKESVELLDESNWEYWKPNDEIDEDNVVEELIDILHFTLSLLTQLGCDADEIYREYVEKNQENIKRQKGETERDYSPKN